MPAAFTALSILEKDAFQFAICDIKPGYEFLQDFFNNEFAADVERSPDYFLRKTIKAFISEAILMPHHSLPDTFNLTSAGYRSLKLYAGFLTTYFESYRIVLNFFKRHPKDFIDSKDRLKKIQSLGNRMHKRKEIVRREALSRINYKNAVDFFTNHGVRGSEDVEKNRILFRVHKKIPQHITCLIFPDINSMKFISLPGFMALSPISVMPFFYKFCICYFFYFQLD
jgi:glycerol-3-phosphate O-acyltransferase